MTASTHTADQLARVASMAAKVATLSEEDQRDIELMLNGYILACSRNAQAESVQPKSRKRTRRSASGVPAVTAVAE